MTAIFWLNGVVGYWSDEKIKIVAHPFFSNTPALQYSMCRNNCFMRLIAQ